MCESAAGPRLEVLLERECVGVILKSNRHNELPWPPARCALAEPRVVTFDPPTKIVRHACVGPARKVDASNEVDVLHSLRCAQAPQKAAVSSGDPPPLCLCFCRSVLVELRRIPLVHPSPQNFSYLKACHP